MTKNLYLIYLQFLIFFLTLYRKFVAAASILRNTSTFIDLTKVHERGMYTPLYSLMVCEIK